MNSTDIPFKTVKFAPKVNETFVLDDRESHQDKEELVARHFPKPVNVTDKGTRPVLLPPPDGELESKETAVDGQKAVGVADKDLGVEITTHADTTRSTTFISVHLGHQATEGGGYSSSGTQNGTNLTVIHNVRPEEAESPGAATSNSTSRTLIVAPVFVGVGLLLIAILFFVHYKKKSQAFKRKSRQTHRTPRLQTIGADFTYSAASESLYTKVDVSKPRGHPNQPEEEILLQELHIAPPANGHCSGRDGEDQLANDETISAKEYRGLLVANYADVYNDADTTLVDNELYEGTRDSPSSSVHDPSTYPLAEGTNRADSGCASAVALPQLPWETDSNESRSETYEESAYLVPSCHPHPAPGPDWKPYHDYDPVYVPHSDPSAMARRLDKAGYVTSKHQRQLSYQAQLEPSDPYEDVQVYSDIEPGTSETATEEPSPSCQHPPPLPPVMRPLTGARPRVQPLGSPPPSAAGRRTPPPTPPSHSSSSPASASSMTLGESTTPPPPRPARSTSQHNQLNSEVVSSASCQAEGQRNSCDSDELYEPVTFSR